MTFPHRASSANRHRDSGASSSLSSYLSLPSRRSSSSNPRRTSSRHSSLSRHSKSGYISPYPLLQGPTSPQGTGSANATTATARGRKESAKHIQPSASWTTALYEDDASITSNEREEESKAKTVGEMIFSYNSERPTLQHHAVMFGPHYTSPAEKVALIEALNEHRVNTLGELARIERVFATLGSSDLTQPMTAAWIYYVNSNSLLAEIRTLTRNYPFSSECLEEAKRRVYQDPNSNRSWNYCWLVLAKIDSDGLIPIYARIQASQPEMWGNVQPMPVQLERLTQAFGEEWTDALAQLLRHWETAPTRPPSPSSGTS